MKTIYITESQKKKLKKAIAAQDQVGGKVNAGVMDSVVGMCENIEDDEYKLGAEKGDISPYYHVNESEDETITLYHGVNRKGLEFNLEHGGFIPRVCSEGGPKAVWLSEKQYGYEFTFAFDIPRNLVEQLSNVDYVYRNEITFDTFNCKLVRSSIYICLDNSTSVEVNLLNDKLSKLHFRYFPDLGILLWKEFKDFPNILEKYINPYIEKYQTLSEDIDKENKMIDINQVINSPEFKTWFGNSKVVDENGKPIIVHHGSPKFEGDKFSKEKVGLSMNSGEGGVFCTTQDMSWAKRFSYPASPGTFNFTVKLDYSHPGDILSGFLKLEHPLDFFHLTEQDWKNIMNMARDTYYSEIIESNPKKWLEDRKLAISQYNNHRFVKHDISSAIRSEFGNFGEQLKRYGYDGYIASMYDGDEEDRNAIEYCFIEPNQFKSIYSLAFNPNSDSIYESKSNINTREEKTDFGKIWYISAVDNSFRFALYKYDDDSNSLYLSNVFVEESNRRQGLGNHILSLVNDFAKKMNVKEVFLKVKKGTFMCKWYEKNGYEYFSDDETDSNYIWMVKEVKQSCIIEGKKKVIKNDKGEIVPEKCDKCGGDVVLQIHGEPVYLCKDCGKYFGTMPFHLNESMDDVLNVSNDDFYSCYSLLSEFDYDKEHGIKQKQWNLIPAQQYHNLLKRYMESPVMARIPYDTVSNWFLNIIVPNAFDLSNITDLAGHSSYFPSDDVSDYFSKEIKDYDDGSEFLDDIGFYDWCKLPDGSDAWSDYGLKPLFSIIEEYTPSMEAGDLLILINRCLDVIHQRGDLSSAFIEGGKYSCDYISNNINENIELEIKPDEVDLSSFNIKKKLNPKFWIDGHLDSRIRLKLLDISDDFIEYLGIDPDIVKDVIMTGSLANFNWNEEFSDIDLHVLLDYSDVDENTEFVKQYFISQKNLWNNEHQDLKIFGFPIEVYVQDINEKHDSSGVYSLDRDKWLREPDRDVLATSKVNKEFIKNKVSDYVNKIDKLLYIYKKAKNDEYKLRKLSEKVEKLWDEIKNSRKIGFEKSGGKEINNNNIVFKSLRRQKYLDKLYDLKTKTYDKLNSL